MIKCRSLSRVRSLKNISDINWCFVFFFVVADYCICGGAVSPYKYIPNKINKKNQNLILKKKSTGN